VYFLQHISKKVVSYVHNITILSYNKGVEWTKWLRGGSTYHLYWRIALFPFVFLIPVQRELTHAEKIHLHKLAYVRLFYGNEQFWENNNSPCIVPHYVGLFFFLSFFTSMTHFELHDIRICPCQDSR
jgi:hypothetical protein